MDTMKSTMRKITALMAVFGAVACVSRADVLRFYDSNNTYSNVVVPSACVATSNITAIGDIAYDPTTGYYTFMNAFGTILVARQFYPGLLYQITASSQQNYGPSSVQQPPTASQAGLYTIYHISRGEAHLYTEIGW